jgi:hypothetical protein
MAFIGHRIGDDRRSTATEGKQKQPLTKSWNIVLTPISDDRLTSHLGRTRRITPEGTSYKLFIV